MHILSKLVKIKIWYCQKNILLIGYNKNLRKLLIKLTFSIVDMVPIMGLGHSNIRESWRWLHQIIVNCLNLEASSIKQKGKFSYTDGLMPFWVLILSPWWHRRTRPKHK
jgi:hypothetical protein